MAGTLPLQAYQTEVLEVTENVDNIDGLEDEEALVREVNGNSTEKGYIDEPPEEEDNNCGEEANSDEPDDGPKKFCYDIYLYALIPDSDEAN